MPFPKPTQSSAHGRSRSALRHRCELVLRHVYPPYFGADVVGRRAVDLVKVPPDVLHALVDAIESGEVWEHSEGALRRRVK